MARTTPSGSRFAFVYFVIASDLHARSPVAGNVLHRSRTIARASFDHFLNSSTCQKKTSPQCGTAPRASTSLPVTSTLTISEDRYAVFAAIHFE